MTSKSYLAYDEDEDKQKRSSKGIPHRINLRLEQYRNTLYNGDPERHTVTMKSLRLSREGKMARYTMQKKGLSDLFYKMRIADDAITCSPLTVKGKYI